MLSKSLLSARLALKQSRVLSNYSRFYFGILSDKPRQEKDTFGPITVPGDKYWGA